MRSSAETSAPQPPDGCSCPPDINTVGLLSFLSLTGLGIVSDTVFNAISLANDLLPAADDVRALLGITSDHPRVNPSVAVPGLTVFAFLVLLASLSPTFFDALIASGDILPFPRDLQKAICSCEGQPAPVAILS